MAQSSLHAGQPAPDVLPRVVDVVLGNVTNGLPGSANSPKPDANMPPIQTPSEPLAAPKQ